MNSKEANKQMEGACGRIVDTEDPNVVIKRMYRRVSKQRRIKSHRAFMQCSLQQTCSQMMEKAGFQLLFIPWAFDAQEYQYSMFRIDVSAPVNSDAIAEDSLVKELSRFYELCYRQGIFPCDYELYKQKDGRIAMVDFDKFGEWKKDGSVLFPFGLELTAERARKHTPLPFPLAFAY